MTQETNLTLHEKLIDIQQRLKVSKDNKNEFGNYQYRNLEDIETAVKPLLKEHKLSLVFIDEMVDIGGRVYVKAIAQISDGDKNIEVPGYAREAETKKGMDDAQITGACSSYARKYAAGGLFLIDNTKDADSMDNSAPAASKEPKKEWKPSSTKKATDKQKEFIANLLRQRGVDIKDMAMYLTTEYNLLPDQFMSEADAAMIIDDLKSDKDER